MQELLLTLLLSFGITFISVPPVIKFAKMRNFLDKPSGRKRHAREVPAIGGVAILIGFIIPILFWIPKYNYHDFSFIYGAGALIMLLLIGLRDDIVPLKASQKLVGQIIAAYLVTYLGGTYITSLSGVFFVHEMPLIVSYIFSVICIVAVVNSFNLIDGINGLAATVGIIACTSFGIWFFLNDKILMYIISFSLCGSLIAFLRFNITPAKIFMGDTGSMLIGFISAVLALRFLEYNEQLPLDANYKLPAGPVLAVSVMIVPIYDTIRVFAVRIISGKSPFQADRNHIHHLLLRLGFSHLKITMILGLTTILLIIISLLAQGLGILFLSIIILTILVLLSIWVDYLLSKKYTKRTKKNKIFQ